MTVYEAWSKVMNEVQAIRKAERNQQQGWSFRGVDAVFQAVGPALRKHGVSVIPEVLSIETERYATRNGGQMQGVIVAMRYTVFGPDGDSFSGSAYGQASDSGDKAVAKAESVAYRTFLLQATTAPTDEPDPDSFVHERVTPPPQPQRPPVDPQKANARMFALATKKLGGPDEPFKRWLADTVGYTGSRRDLNPDQVAWIITQLDAMDDHDDMPEPTLEEQGIN